MAAKPALEDCHRNARLNFARKHMAMGSNWDHVIFSDEKKFNLDGPDGFRFYWRDLRKEPKTIFSRNFGGGSVMVWAGFSANGKTAMAFISGRQNAEAYQLMLEDHLLPFGPLIGGQNWIFQQDNASIHAATSTWNWMAEWQVKWLDWPSRSPDLNPIENLWGIMVRRLYRNGRQFMSVTELKAAIAAEWDAIQTTNASKVGRLHAQQNFRSDSKKWKLHSLLIN
jgi:hypothetical protein